jgi:DNA replication protein DnaC
VELTAQELEQMLELLKPWARHVKAQELNSALLRQQMAAQAQAQPQPWLTAEQIFDAVQVVGAQLYPGFVVDSYLYPVLVKLAYYFARNPHFETLGEGYDRSKGLLLFGPVGCGKSILFKILAKIDPRFSFKIAQCDEMAERFHKEGVGSLEQYYQPGGRLYLDDLGAEQYRVQNFGFKCNPLADVLTRRERLEPRPRTFASTNCDAETLERIYEERACSRMVAMFNFIEFDEETPDRRKLRPEPITQEDVQHFSYLLPQ